jgi:hypothetical protein
MLFFIETVSDKLAWMAAYNLQVDIGCSHPIQYIWASCHWVKHSSIQMWCPNAQATDQFELGSNYVTWW